MHADVQTHTQQLGRFFSYLLLCFHNIFTNDLQTFTLGDLGVINSDEVGGNPPKLPADAQTPDVLHPPKPLSLEVVRKKLPALL